MRAAFLQYEEGGEDKYVHAVAQGALCAACVRTCFGMIFVSLSTCVGTCTVPMHALCRPTKTSSVDITDSHDCQISVQIVFLTFCRPRCRSNAPWHHGGSRGLRAWRQATCVRSGAGTVSLLDINIIRQGPARLCESGQVVVPLLRCCAFNVPRRQPSGYHKLMFLLPAGTSTRCIMTRHMMTLPRVRATAPPLPEGPMWCRQAPSATMLWLHLAAGEAIAH